MSDTIRITAQSYQQFDADYDLEVPAEGMTGWREEPIDIAADHTAVVLMHAWNCGTKERYPGWWRAVPYLPGSYEICETVLPPLLEAVRASKLRLYHVVGGGKYYQHLPGYQQTAALVEPATPPPGVHMEPTLQKLRDWRFKNVHPGEHNIDDIKRGQAVMDFPEQARPQGDEPVAENSEQLFALCQRDKVNHLIYAGFAINWCLLKSPGGMVWMAHQHGMMCSAIRDAVVAVESAESAREQAAKNLALWHVAVAYGFVFESGQIIKALKSQA